MTIKYTQTEKGHVFNLDYGFCFLCFFAIPLIITFPIFSAFFA